MLEKINKFARSPLTEDEIYVFSVTLCDNDIDCDGERFSDKSLEQIAEIFVGKTSYFDRDPSSPNQTVRIFDTEIITDDSRITKNGDTYRYVKANAYMIRTDENRSLIAEIDGGIKKEVSISCSVNKRICSICGCNKYKVKCLHEKGESYGGKRCYVVLDGILDAYEWSFVSDSVPTGKCRDDEVQIENLAIGSEVKEHKNCENRDKGDEIEILRDYIKALKSLYKRLKKEKKNVGQW